MTIAKVLSCGYLSLEAVMISKHIAIAIIEESDYLATTNNKYRTN